MGDPHILVVDDHRDIREPLAVYLKKHALRVSVAADATAARQALTRHAIDLIVLDVMMPGEDGISLCRHVRETYGTTYGESWYMSPAASAAVAENPSRRAAQATPVPAANMSVPSQRRWATRWRAMTRSCGMR